LAVKYIPFYWIKFNLLDAFYFLGFDYNFWIRFIFLDYFIQQRIHKLSFVVISLKETIKKIFHILRLKKLYPVLLAFFDIPYLL